MIKCKTSSSLSYFSSNFKSLLITPRNSQIFPFFIHPLHFCFSLFNFSLHFCHCSFGVFRTLHHSTTPAAYASSSECDISHYIIEDQNLLRPSLSSKTSGLHVLDLIDRGSIEPNRILYKKLVKKCTFLGKFEEGSLVHSHIVKSELKNDVSILNSVVIMYAKCGRLENARQVFDEMPVKDRITWNSMITGYSKNDCAIDALVLFPKMLCDGLRPNECTLLGLVKSCAFIPSYNDGRQIHGCCWKNGFQSNAFVGSSLVDMYSRCGYLDEARLVFDELGSKDVVSWNALISGYARKGDVEEAVALFVKMQREDCGVTSFTYSALLCSCSSVGSLEQGKLLHAHMMKSGTELVGYMGNTLLNMYAKSGSISDAKKVFDRLVRVDVVSCSSMLIGYAHHGFGEEAVELFEDMLLWVGIEPDDRAFLYVIIACSHAGLLEKGKYYFELMRKYGIEPNVLHYTAVVDLLGRAGLLDQAKSFIEEMPIEPDATIWGALLGASKTHENMEMGSYAAQRVLELDPFNSWVYALLASIYASAGKWEDVAKVIKMKQDNGLKKNRACSWVET